MANAARDDNNVPALIAASSTDGETPVRVYANPTTHRLLTSTSTLSGPVSSTDTAIVLWDGTTGLTVKDSGVKIDGSGNFSGTSNVPYITTGTAAPLTTPGKVGDMFVDTTHTKVYVATGTSSSADWTALN